MGGSPDLDLLRFLVLILLSLAHTYAVAETATSTAATCPMDFSYVLRIPWNRSLCQNFRPPDENENTNTSKPQCCQSLLSLFGVAVAQHLKETSLFRLPNLATSISCLRDYQSKLNSFSLANNLVSYCLDPLQFVTKPNICARIESLQDWVARLGKSTSLDTACKSDLTDNTACDGCVRAGYKVQSMLLSIDGNQTHATYCFYFAILYAAGIVNEFGPESDGAASCIFGLELNSRVGSASKAHSALVFGLTGAGVALLVMFSLLGLYFWYDKKWRRKKNSGFGFDLDEQQGSRPRLRPNTGSIWFKIQDLEKATDNFSQKNFIGRGGFGFVYKGTLSDGTVVAIKRVIESDFQGAAEFCNEVEIISNLKHRNLVPLRGCCVIDDDDDDGNNDERGNQRYLVYDYMSNGNLDDHLFPSSGGSPRALLITDWAWSLLKAGKVEEALDASLLRCGDSSNSNPKGIMERFVLVGILCAHVMVALRPTILVALKMLEGDIEVPPIPDRPMPLGHPSFHSDGNNFSISPALSGDQNFFLETCLGKH
uniref:Putative receptor-like protein kinase n=1 Tax=Populus alba TaxID=43335 RepID=A0A4V6A3R9_POPAL|nr:putative receptor-like protein kinase [Populus alba]